MLRRLARFSLGHRRLVAAAWVVLFVAGIAIGSGVFDRLDPDVGDVEGTESARADARLRDLDPGGPSIAALADGVDPRDPRTAAAVRATAERLRAIPGVAQVAEPFGGPPELLARDGRAALVAVEFAPGLDDDRFDQALEAAEAELRRLDAPRVLVGGGPLQDQEFEDQVAADLARAELLSMPVVLVLLLVVFGGFVAAGLPVLVALVGVAGTLLALFGISAVTDVSVYSVNVVTMLGLGLAVDYALLLVSRFREERVTRDLPAAVEEAVATAGRTVVFSGLTVAASLAGLLVFDDPFLRSMAYGGGAVVLIDLLAAVTLLPALLGSWGARVRPRTGAGAEASGLFAAISRVVQRRAALIVVLVAVPLAVAATPFLRANYQQPDATFLPAGAESRQLFETLEARFEPAVWVEPVVLVANAGTDPAGLAQVAAFGDRISDLDGVRSVGEPRPLGDGVAVVEVLPEGSGTDATAARLVADVRALPRPFPIQVTGDAAGLTDYQATIAERLPLAAGLVALATFALLFAFTGSVVVPVKAIVMNVLSLGASFGALVWVFQEGHLAGLLGAEGTGSIDPTVPVLTFAITFGLSMDYEVFLLSRIKEAWDETGDNDLAVALGLQRTGRIVTSAALLLVVVFAGFMAAGMLTIKQIGLATVLAVLLDATVVRMLLVPATMKLMGRWNWWAPAPLRRLHRRIGLDERAAARPSAQPSWR
ncbi:MAG TPA: MMPL family transporter [Actinomycetota bacterium]|jgi:RND superfamily putative drug exporter|nr:MMPL family transporter [Actinomycetota bacterium]